MNTIFLFNDNDINSPAEGGRVDRIPCLGDGAADTPNVLHPSKWCLAPWNQISNDICKRTQEVQEVQEAKDSE